MTTLAGFVFDGAKGGVGDRLLLEATATRGATTTAGGIVGPAPVEVAVAAGTGEFTTPDLEPGPYRVRILWQKSQAAEYHDIIVPTTGTNLPLWDLVSSYVAVPPETPTARIAGAVATYLDENPPAGGGDLTKAVADQTYAPVARALPTGGEAGQIPVKTADGVVWQAAPSGGGGSAGLTDDGTGMFTISAGSSITEDASNPGLYLIGA